MEIKNYLDELKITLDNLDEDQIHSIIDQLNKCRKEGKRVFLCGNGGSAAAASHFANDLAKLTISEGKPRMKVISLTDNLPLITAWANDSHYDDCFVEQLKNHFQPGDTLLAISGSGNSGNIIKAVEYVNQNNGFTIGLTGFEGGKLAAIANKSIVVNSDSMQRIEDVHTILIHLIASVLKE